MNRLSPLHKKILSSLAEIYATDEKKGHSNYYSKRQLREILITFKWDKDKAIKAIEDGQCYYWWAND